MLDLSLVCLYVCVCVCSFGGLCYSLGSTSIFIGSYIMHMQAV